MRASLVLALAFFAASSVGARAGELSSTIAPERLDAVARSKPWLRLLHFRTNWFMHFRSLVDDQGFFLSPQGRTDPRAELIATIDAVASKDRVVGHLKQHPQCAYPERFRFLKRELKLAVEDVACPKLDEFLGRIKARSLTLVFSSAFPNNPGSMFGHTFLRVNADEEKKNDLLDQAISYAALVPKEDGGLEFAVKGLLGGYVGQWALLPYYTKVNEYSNAESRDLWEYDLSLDREQTLTVIRHVWELETNALRSYYFFDENCSYLLLEALEVARPEWDLTSFPIYVIPGETVKKLARTGGAIRDVKFRPSLRRRVYQRLRALDGGQRALFFRLIRFEQRPQEVGDRAVLESVASYLYYRKQESEGKLADADAALLHDTAVHRAELGPGPEDRALPSIEADMRSRPDEAHNTYRLGTSSGIANTDFFQELEFKFAFHDLLNDDTGYIRFSQIDFPGVTVRYTPARSSKISLEHVEGLAITSLFPMDFLEKRPSWKAAVDLYSPKDYGCRDCDLFRGRVGAGATVELFSPDYIAYSLGELDIESGSSLRTGYRWGPRLESAVLLNPVRRYKVQLGYVLATDLLQHDRPGAYSVLEWNQSFSLSPWWELRSHAELTRGYHEEKLSLNFYF